MSVDLAVKRFWKESEAGLEAEEERAMVELYEQDVKCVVENAEININQVEEGDISSEFGHGAKPEGTCKAKCLFSGEAPTFSQYSSECPEADPLNPHFVPLKDNFWVPDQKSLIYVPSGIDETKEDIFELYDTTEREREVTFGPRVMQERMAKLIDNVLRSCLEDPDISQNLQGEALDKLVDLLADISNAEEDFVEERVRVVTGALCDPIAPTQTPKISTPGRLAPASPAERHLNLELPTTPREDMEVEPMNLDDDSAEDEMNPVEVSIPEQNTNTADLSTPKRISEPEEDVVEPGEESGIVENLDSYRVLFCPRCFVFDCNSHGVRPDQSSADFQLQRGVIYDRELEATSMSDSDEPMALFSRDLEIADTSICLQLFQIFEGNLPQIAAILRVSVESVDSFVLANGIEFVEPSITVPKAVTKTGRGYYAPSNYIPTWCQNIENAEIHPTFDPCYHEGLCWEGVCSCVDHAFFCTPACVWGSRSNNFFRGCSCKGQCKSTICSCFSSNRECDPELCGCDGCSDPAGVRQITQQCLNDNITMKRHAHLLVHKSTIAGAGWGCFTKFPLKKGDFLDEYVGEVVSQDEAERRGMLYDQKNLSYLFNLSSEVCIDASSYGNIMRFLNHSSTPNCEAVTKFVNGEHRIGFYAIHDIKAEEELFFDYQYDNEMDNRYIKMEPKEFSWLQTRTDSDTKPPPGKKRKSSKSRKKRR